MIFDVSDLLYFEISSTLRRVKTFVEMRLEYPNSKMKIHRELKAYDWLEEADYEQLEQVYSFLIFVSEMSNA